MRANAFAVCAALAAIMSLPISAADVEAEEARTGGKGRSHWHVGPFFEYRRAEPGPATFWAVRPFYSQVRDPATRTVTRDVPTITTTTPPGTARSSPTATRATAIPPGASTSSRSGSAARTAQARATGARSRSTANIRIFSSWTTGSSSCGPFGRRTR